jgi:hypothetical protein
MNLFVRHGIYCSLSAITLAAALDGVHINILSAKPNDCLYQFATIAQVVIVFPVPGGPWIRVSLSVFAF